MVAAAETALSQLGVAKDIGARLVARLQALEDEESQVFLRLQRLKQAEADVGELVPDAEALIHADSPAMSTVAKDGERLIELRSLIAQLKSGVRSQADLIRRLERDASKEVIAGAEGDRWRKAARKLAKAVADLAEADAEVYQAQQELQTQLPVPAALMAVRFPPGPRASFEPGDVGTVATRFTERLLEVDRHYGS